MIDDLQHENDELRHGDGSIDRLEEALHSAQYALDKATGDRLKLENDFKIQVDNDAITVNRLKNEGIDLKHALADRNEEIARLRSTLSNLRYTVDLKRGDNNHLKDEFRLNREDHEHLKDVADRLDRDIKIEVDVNNGLRKELDDYNNRIRVNDDDHHNHVGRIRKLEADNNNSRANQDDLNRDIDDVEHRIRDVTAKISVLEGKARGLRVDLDHLESTIGDLTGKHDAESDLFSNVRADLDKEKARGRDLQERHKALVTSIEDGRRELDDLRREVENLNDKIRGVTSSNADLEYQLAELKRHIDVLSRQNHSLNVEIDEILDLDRRVREELDRRASLAQKQKMNEENLKKSLSDLQRTRTRSPTRA